MASLVLKIKAFIYYHQNQLHLVRSFYPPASKGVYYVVKGFLDLSKTNIGLRSQSLVGIIITKGSHVKILYLGTLNLTEHTENLIGCIL